SDIPLAKYSVAELRRQYPHQNPPVLNNLLRLGETCNLVAPTKSGKSWLAHQLVLAVATGTPWLGKIETLGGPVLLIDNELQSSTLAARLDRVADAMGIAPARYE